MLSDVYFPRINGVSTSIQTFRRELDALDVPVRLVAPCYPASWNDDALTQRIPARRVPLDPEDRIMSPRKLLRACRELAGTIDLVHIQTPFVAHWAGVNLARELGLATVETYHTYFEQYFHHYAPFLPSAFLRSLARRISRTQCNAVDAVIAPSRPMADVLREYGVERPIEVIGTGLELDRFERGDGDRFRDAHGIARDRPVVLHVGRIAFEKNIELIVDAFAEVVGAIPDALLVIAGEGPALRALRAKVAAMNLGASVEFVGYLDRETVLLDCYRSANVFAFASKTETQGLVLLEAMAVGTPVVSTAALGTKDVLERDGAGAIVVPQDRRPFAAALTRLLRDRDLQARLGGAGRVYVHDAWSAEAMALKVRELYLRLSGGGALDVARPTVERSTTRVGV